MGKERYVGFSMLEGNDDDSYYIGSVFVFLSLVNKSAI